jgi:hypothetical protein
MRQPNGRRVISRDQYDAVLFDLDGVITNTAKLHAACWKQMLRLASGCLTFIQGPGRERRSSLARC